MEFSEDYFGYDPERDADRPIKFKLVRDHKDWYYAYWRFADEEVKKEEIIVPVEDNNVIKRFINKLFGIKKFIKDTKITEPRWHKVWFFIAPICVERPESDGWMSASWEFYREGDVKCQLGHLNYSYPTIAKFHNWVMNEIKKSREFLKWKDDVRKQRNSMKDSYE